MTTKTPALAVEGFDSRGTLDAPFGYIEFSDGLRIGYAPGTRQANEDGLFDAEQPYLAQKEGREPGPRHWLLATAWVRDELPGRMAQARELMAQLRPDSD